MRNANVWLCGLVVGVALAGAAMFVGSPSISRAEPERGRDHWHHHDGKWSYWHEGDKRWYYTDGDHWYYNTGDSWKVYTFDKQFGREGFERGEYKVPGEGVKVVIPRHRIFVPR